VKKFIQKIFAMNKIVMVILFLAICAGLYTLTGIVSNVKQMAAAYSQAYFFPTYPAYSTQGKTADEIALIKRGEYLVKVGDCIACHTNSAKKSPAFAGGLAMQTPFGVIYTPNITPDKETGIGGWNDDMFIKAMHEGISPSGEYYYPAFPYLYFSIVTFDDLKAIKAYLNSIPAVHQKNHPNDMVWPFNWRFLQLGWRLLFFDTPKNGTFKPDPKQSEQWNRGAYFVEGLGHCGMCHTPSYYMISKQLPLGAPIRKYNLTGANIQGYVAPNITKTNLNAIPDEELIKVFTQYQLIGGGKVKGPMYEAVHDSLSHLTRADLLAMITYLKSVESKMPPQPDVSEGAVGQYIYNSYCSACHNYGVGGATKFGDAASWGPLVRSGIDKLYAVAISGGGNMPAKGTCLTCSDLEIKYAVDYMVAASMKGAKPISPPTRLGAESGEQIYQEYCSSCHTTGKNNAPKLGDQQAWKPIVDTGFLSAYRNVVAGRKGHPPRGGCTHCNDEELLAAIKYIMQKGAPHKNYQLW